MLYVTVGKISAGKKKGKMVPVLAVAAVTLHS